MTRKAGRLIGRLASTFPAVLVVGALLLAGCGTGEDEASDATISSAADTSTSTVVSDGGEVLWSAHHLDPEDGLRSVTSVAVLGLVETSEPTRPLVVFWAGTDECYGLEQVVVEESEREVRIEVRVGRRVPDDTMCIEIAHRYAAEVELTAPVGDRSVVDAAAPEVGGSNSTSSTTQVPPSDVTPPGGATAPLPDEAPSE